MAMDDQTLEKFRSQANLTVGNLPTDLQEIVWVGAATVAATRFALTDKPTMPGQFQVMANMMAIELATFLHGRVQGPPPEKGR